jgi:hypothetical protein
MRRMRVSTIPALFENALRIYLILSKLLNIDFLKTKNRPFAWGEKSVRGTTQFITQLNNGSSPAQLTLFQPATRG